MKEPEFIKIVLNQLEAKRKRKLTEREKAVVIELLEPHLEGFYEDIMKEYGKTVEKINRIYMKHHKELVEALSTLNQPNIYNLSFEIMSVMVDLLRGELGSFSFRKDEGEVNTG